MITISITMTAPHVISIQVGLPKTLGTKNAPNPLDRPWTTGFYKAAIAGKVWLSKTNIEGDGQADLENHGGLEKAVLAYGAAHYPGWRESLQLPDLGFGAFGENLTVVGQTEADVCIGDIYEFGEAQLQVSQPRQPCWKLSRRLRVKDLAQQVIRNGKSGWYFRVLKEGYIEPGQNLILGDRPHPEWPIPRAHDVMHHQRKNKTAIAELLACPALSSSWKQTLTKRL